MCGLGGIVPMVPMASPVAIKVLGKRYLQGSAGYEHTQVCDSIKNSGINYLTSATATCIRAHASGPIIT